VLDALSGYKAEIIALTRCTAITTQNRRCMLLALTMSKKSKSLTADMRTICEALARIAAGAGGRLLDLQATSCDRRSTAAQVSSQGKGHEECCG
jgi:hypothetical protein